MAVAEALRDSVVGTVRDVMPGWIAVTIDGDQFRVFRVSMKWFHAVMFPRLGNHHLMLIAALGQTGTVSEAARRLGLTQSAASHRVREAERRVGAALIVRHPRGIQLTSDGQRIAAFAERFLSEQTRLEEEIGRAHDNHIVRLGQATYSRYHWLPDFLEFLSKREPDLSPYLSGAATARPLASLMDGSVDVSIVFSRPSQSRRFTWNKLGKDPLIAVMAPGHPLASAHFVTSDDLINERIFLYPFASEPGFEWEALVGQPTAPFRNVTTMPTPEAVIDLVRAGFGVSLFSRWAIEPELASSALVGRPIGKEGMVMDWWAATRTGYSKNSPTTRLVDALLYWSDNVQTGLERLTFDG